MTRKPAARDAAALLAAALVASPVFVGLVYALLGAMGLAGAGRTPGEPRIGRVLAEPALWSGLLWSVGTAAAATLLAFAGAVAIAVAFRGTTRTDGLARFLAVSTLPVPHIAAAVMGVLILGQSGLLSRIAYAAGLIAEPAGMPVLIYDAAGIGFILSMAWKELPFLALIALTVLLQRNRAWEEAARTLGATPWQTFLAATWPALWRGMLPGAVAAFIFVAGTYEAAALLAPSRPLPLAVLQMERYTGANLAQRGDAFVIALVLFGLAIVAVVAHEWLRGRPRGEA